MNKFRGTPTCILDLAILSPTPILQKLFSSKLFSSLSSVNCHENVAEKLLPLSATSKIAV